MITLNLEHAPSYLTVNLFEQAWLCGALLAHPKKQMYVACVALQLKNSFRCVLHCFSKTTTPEPRGPKPLFRGSRLRRRRSGDAPGHPRVLRAKAPGGGGRRYTDPPFASRKSPNRIAKRFGGKPMHGLSRVAVQIADSALS